ncbi:hypothetical protein FHR83_002243 [Actinoplanes campanulatus]|uniref:Uncharacterized protein n=1 Tax=Actinoplanes campanulatus TaxID=113559 RepID=A0A7W5AE24_9ACTN|nr:hypothetical protein [Actinoplanes campanulatus]MBB3094591.1 hypothetical protein [Actinoplanes campanulatus]
MGRRVVERRGSGDKAVDGRGRPSTLRIAGYVAGHAEPVADEPAEPDLSRVRLPDISDYWPDAIRRIDLRAGRAGHPRPAGTPRPPRLPGGPPTTGDHGRRWAGRRPVILAGLLALVFAGGTVLLTRPLTDSGRQQTLPAAEAPTDPVSVAPLQPAAPSAATSAPATPSPTPTKPATTAPVAPKPPERVREARFELASGVTELSVRTVSLDDGQNFRVTTPSDSGLDLDTSFDDGVLRVEATSDGSGGSGRVDVRLSDRIVWDLRMGAGVHTASFDMGTGTVGRIDLRGGAQTIDIEVGRLSSTLPVRMAGGVHTWRIRTAQRVPVRVAVGAGAGDITLYGHSSGGVGAGDRIRSGDLDDRPGLDVDAEAGIGFMEVFED